MSNFSIHHALCGVLLLGSLAMPVIVQADTDIDITTAPPAPQTEAVPEPRTGYIWSPGYWAWNAELSRHEWIKGHWVEEVKDQHWVADKWSEDPSTPGHWHFTPGHWEP